jgi:hypothetical protein
MRFIDWMKSFFAPKKTRSRVGEELTEWERYHIKKSQGCCPDCEIGRFLAGPSAGVSQNVQCDSCGARFNIVPLPKYEMLFAERIP